MKGFSVVGTGGNCTALARSWEHGGHVWEVLVTEELSAPENWNNPIEPIVVSVYLDEEPSHYVSGVSSPDEAIAAAAELILTTMGGDVDYTLCEVWPEWIEETPHPDKYSFEVLKA